MSKQHNLKPLAIAIGAALVASAAAIPAANADQNLFGMTELSSGYMTGDSGTIKFADGKCGGSQGEGKKGEGKCGEGKCGEK